MGHRKTARAEAIATDAPSTDGATGERGTPRLPDVSMHLHTPQEPAVARVVSSERCTLSRKSSSFVRHIVMDISDSRMVGQILPGQSFGVLPPGTDDRGRPHKLRLYSVASPSFGEEGGSHLLATTVKRTTAEHRENHRLFLGVASNYLCDLQEGEEVRITGPSGKRFLLPEDPTQHDYLFIATGTGIAPFRGMMMDLARTSPGSRVALVMGAAYETDLLYHGQMLDLCSQHEHWAYLTALSREPQRDGHDPMYVHERLEINADTLVPMLESERTLVYLCGVAGMELGVFRAMSRVLTGRHLEQYLQIDPEILDSDEPWDRRMIHRRIRPTKRVFLEVYA